MLMIRLQGRFAYYFQGLNGGLHIAVPFDGDTDGTTATLFEQLQSRRADIEVHQTRDNA
jgi:hypothetical protein